jgi:hypothetical protein
MTILTVFSLTILKCWVKFVAFTSNSHLCMVKLYITLVRSKLEYASVVWNSIKSTDANKLERIQQRFAALRFNILPPEVHYSYSLALEELKLPTLHMRRHRLDALFLIQICSGFKFCPFTLEIAGLPVPTRYIRDFALFSAAPHVKSVPLLRRSLAANVVCRGVDLFAARNVLLNY